MPLRREIDSLSVANRNPLRRLAEQVVLTGMRPPLLPTLLQHRPNREVVDLAGKRVLLTGASSGIGEAAAEQLARHGATVVAVARRRELLDGLVDRIAAAGGRNVPEARAYVCDLADMAAIDGLVAAVEADLGGIDILVNNAGRSIRRPLAESLDRWHDVERTMTLNYFAPLRLIRGLAPGMISRGDGHVINVATWGVKTESPPLFGVYNASKAALSSVSRILETEWGDDGVHSTTLYYPLVKTPMIAPTREYHGLPALSADEAAGWIITAARHRPVSIAPRVAVTAAAVNSVAPGVVDTLMKRQRLQPND
ncbi:SDR family oxidoreductase [Mycobacterium sp. Y57]|uniref:SDR family oxidoreductase n=1 Tax=Mycolicibacterium xanthum TaxID=2796469 RepID=UPI001C85FBF3|nr:SDR family oxidoreductase [Mycolicibacterium xanthum]MBX7435521.1 SDR family oxidoreductase [Mycolicibacterium xanthum]